MSLRLAQAQPFSTQRKKDCAATHCSPRWAHVDVGPALTQLCVAIVVVLDSNHVAFIIVDIVAPCQNRLCTHFHTFLSLKKPLVDWPSHLT